MGERAANVGSPTQHLVVPAAPGPGSLKVYIGGSPAWRASMDGHLCAMPIAPPAPDVHKIEKCYLGSFNVLIDGKMAVREGDKLLGMGPPNSILRGWPTVKIGTAAFGLADRANMDEY